jgi:large subunit ribosomal protein L17
MRHRKKVKKLGRTASHRKSLLQNIAASLIEHHQIRTTLAKAKAAQSHIEKLITHSKEDSVHARRLAFKFLQNRTLVKKLFDEIAPTYDDRKGGYTRVIKLGRRQGDGAELAILQLVGFEKLLVEESQKKKKRKKAAGKAAPAAKPKPAKEAAEEPVEEIPAAEEKPKAKKEAKKPKAEETAEPEAVKEEKEEPGKPDTDETAESEEAKEAKEEKTEKKPKAKKAKKEDKEGSEEETEKS